MLTTLNIIKRRYKIQCMRVSLHILTKKPLKGWLHLPSIVQARILRGCTQVAASKKVSATSCFSNKVHTTP